MRERRLGEKNGLCHRPREENRNNDVQWGMSEDSLFVTLETKCKILHVLRAPLRFEAK